MLLTQFFPSFSLVHWYVIDIFVVAAAAVIIAFCYECRWVWWWRNTYIIVADSGTCFSVLSLFISARLVNVDDSEIRNKIEWFGVWCVQTYHYNIKMCWLEWSEINNSIPLMCLSMAFPNYCFICDSVVFDCRCFITASPEFIINTVNFTNPPITIRTVIANNMWNENIYNDSHYVSNYIDRQ